MEKRLAALETKIEVLLFLEARRIAEHAQQSGRSGHKRIPLLLDVLLDELDPHRGNTPTDSAVIAVIEDLLDRAATLAMRPAR